MLRTAQHVRHTLELIDKYLVAHPELPKATAEWYVQQQERLSAVDGFFTWLARVNPDALGRMDATRLVATKFRGPDDEMMIGLVIDKYDPQRKAYQASFSFGGPQIEAHSCDCPNWTAQTACMHVAGVVRAWYLDFNRILEERAGHRTPVRHMPSPEKQLEEVAKKEVPKLVKKIVSPDAVLNEIRELEKRGPVGAFAKTLSDYESQARTLDALFAVAIAKSGTARIFRSRDIKLSKVRVRVNPLVIFAEAPGSTGETYKLNISFNPRGFRCSCPDGQRGREVGPCKHVLALATFWLTAIDKSLARFESGQ